MVGRYDLDCFLRMKNGMSHVLKVGFIASILLLVFYPWIGHSESEIIKIEDCSSLEFHRGASRIKVEIYASDPYHPWLIGIQSDNTFIWKKKFPQTLKSMAGDADIVCQGNKIHITQPYNFGNKRYVQTFHWNGRSIQLISSKSEDVKWE